MWVNYLPSIDGRSRYDVNRTSVSIFRVIPVRSRALRVQNGREVGSQQNPQSLPTLGLLLFPITLEINGFGQALCGDGIAESFHQ